MTGKSTFLLFVVLVTSTVYLISRDEKTVGVNLHGVNHTAETFSFYLKNPANPEMINGGSGLIDPFGTSGISCCAVLPRRWKRGLKLQIHTTHWQKSLPDETLPEIKQVVEVEIPKYIEDKPGEIWILRNKSGKVEVVASEYQPDHPKWPGKIKGWPIPTAEYRLERWNLHRQIEAGAVEVFTQALEKLETSPDASAREAWSHAQQHRPQDLTGFRGPNDPLYIADLKSRYATILETSRQNLQRIMEAKP